MISSQQGPHFTYIDSGSFNVLLVGKNGIITGVENKIANTTNSLVVNKDGCKYTLINPGANHGHIHITGVKEIKVTGAEKEKIPPGQPPDYPLVEITFVPAPMMHSIMNVEYIMGAGTNVISTNG